MKYKSFKDYVILQESEGVEENTDKDWRKKYIQIDPGFVPPPKMRSIIEAFLKSNEIKIMADTTKEVTMPKKSLFLVGGAVRDFLKGKTIKNYCLATDATPEQTAQILHSAGFKMENNGKKLNLTFKPREATVGDKKTWKVNKQDGSRKAISIIAEVDGEPFEINTLYKGPKGATGANSKVEFTNNPKQDSEGRDLTMNSLYIELTKSDGPNTKLYDPQGTGHHDVTQGIVKTIGGNVEKSFREDPIRIMRAIKFHCRFSKGELDKDINQAIAKLKEMDGVDKKSMTSEFIEGLLHPDIDPRCYVNMYKKTGLLKTLFPGVKFDPPDGVPTEMTDKKDKALSLAWLLQHNPVEQIEKLLDTENGYTPEDRRAVTFLLKLKEFNPKELGKFSKQKNGTGLSKQQIEDWVDMFNVKGTNRNRRPWWAKHVRKFAKYQPSVTWDDVLKSGREIEPGVLDSMELEKFMKDE